MPDDAARSTSGPNVSTPRSYGSAPVARRHPWTDRGVLVAFAVTAVGAWVARAVPVPMMLCAAVLGLVGLRWGVLRPPARLLTIGALGLIAGALAAGELRAIDSAPMGPWTGVAILRSDPDRTGAGVRVVLEVQGFRYEAWAWGAPARSVERRLAGERVVVVGERHPLEGRRRGSLHARHVVGRFDLALIAGSAPGPAPALAANRVHRAVGRVVQHWPADRRALLAGLVLGNDSALSPEAVAAFRTAGLSHLTAVSGQNVALLLTLMAPLLARTDRGWRWLLTAAVIAWFAVLTRFEPSVLRASVMALAAATATVLGRDRRPARLLALSGVVLMLVDPLLVRSVSFWLSMSATAGLVVVTPALKRVLEGRQSLETGRVRRAVASALATTAGAQTGVLCVSTVVFGLPSSVSLVTNLLAVPPAGLVMMSGPAVAAVGAVAPEWAFVAATPLRWLVDGIAGIAHVGARLAPPRQVDVVVWCAVLAASLRGIWTRARGR